jgi:hypothetical protein
VCGLRAEMWNLTSRRLGKSFGIDQAFGNIGSPPPIKEEDRIHWTERYAPDIAEVESLLGRDLEV